MKRLSILLSLVILTLGKGYAQYNVSSDTTAIGLGATSTSSVYKFSYNGHLIAHFGVGWYDDPDLSGGPMAYFGGYGGIKFFTNGLPRLDINYNGNVGIGTTNPTVPLQVNGSIYSTTTDYSRLSTGSALTIVPGAATGNTYSIIQQSTSGGTAAGNILLNPYGGNILINQTSQSNPAYKLDVWGSARANKMVVNATGADFVFEPAYKLPKLSDVQKYVAQYHHLFEIPSAVEMQKDGMDVGELNTKLLQKVEELTLYLIEKDKQIKEQDERLKKIEAQLDALTQQKKD